MDRNTLLITIDGPAGSGKSTISKGLADRIGGRRLDTGAIYRAFAWKAYQEGISDGDPSRLAAIGTNFPLVMSPDGTITLGGTNITEAIRTPAISQMASRIAAIPVVREALLELQRRLSMPGPTVCEGRDMGTVVFPHAPVKFFLTASAEARAQRRFKELVAKGEAVEYEDILRQQMERDARDAGRDVAPLRPAEDAILVDSTAMSIQEVIDHMAQWIDRRIVAPGA